MRKKVFIRADGSTEIGLGHLVRCVALAQMLKCDFHVTLFCKRIPDLLIKGLENEKIEICIIEEETEFFSKIKENIIVVLDGYNFDIQYQISIKARKSLLICIDDIHDRQFVADVIINHAPNIKASNYLAQNAIFCLGLKYALLRPAFLNPLPEKTVEEIRNVLVCFGGADKENLTLRVLSILSEYSQFAIINVVTGPAFPHLSSLIMQERIDSRIIHFKDIDEVQMSHLMSTADLSIVPASGTLLEAISVGNIIISGMYAKNQLHLYSHLNRCEAFFDAVNFSDHAIRKAIDKSLGTKTLKPRLIDGNSGKRLLKIFKQLALAAEIELSEATIADLETTFKWASDSKIRAFSFNTREIHYETHKTWFSNKLNDRNCFYFIGKSKGHHIGSVRFDVEEKVAKISYLIDTNFQGKGMGQIILQKGVSLLAKLANEREVTIHELVGLVRHDNLASIISFEKLGYTKHEEIDCIKFHKVLGNSNQYSGSYE